VEIRLSDPALVPSLIAELASDPSTVVSQVGVDGIEASLIGSYRPTTMRTILAMRVWEWQEKQAASGQDVTVTIV
jgi:hypothetical protein